MIRAEEVFLIKQGFGWQDIQSMPSSERKAYIKYLQDLMEKANAPNG